ncbi:MAG: DUF1573 domain-containing protein [Acidobacteriota bacterium]
MMRRILSVPTRSILTVAVLFAATAVLAEAGPKAVPKAPIEDFDIVPKGSVIEHAFEIKNDGTAPLVITDVRPSCGCTVVNYDETIAPGATGQIQSAVDTTDFSGPISKSIAVFTNDPENPKLQLVVKAKVKPFVGVKPGYARYVYVKGEEIRPLPQVVYSADGADFDILEVKAPYDYLKVGHRTAEGEERFDKAEGPQHMIDIELGENAPIGALRQYVEVVTNHPKQPVVRIPISGFVRPRAHITPQKLDFGKLQGETLPLRRTFHLTNFGTNEIQIQKIDTGVDGMVAEVEKSKRQPGHRFQLKLTLGPEMPKGSFDTIVRVHTNDPQNPIVELPLQGEIL